MARGRPGAAAGAVPAAAGGAGLPHRGTAAERLATQQQPRKGLGWPPTGAPGRATPKVPTAVASKQPSPACAEDAQQNDDEEGFVYPDKVRHPPPPALIFSLLPDLNYLVFVYAERALFNTV